jgi:ABC-type transporter Mla maintaining outer membrane lipid asymmetry ATPase subunit MlaF
MFGCPCEYLSLLEARIRPGRSPMATCGASIARALASEPPILQLDGPAAGCNAVETRELDRIIRVLAKGGITAVLVEHDMRLVGNISDRIHALANGQTLAEGAAEEVRTNPAVIVEGRLSGYGRIVVLHEVSLRV